MGDNHKRSQNCDFIWLVVQCAHLEKYEFANGKDDILYIMENKIHVPNHQLVMVFSGTSWGYPWEI
jgi:hypothetical protein